MLKGKVCLHPHRPVRSKTTEHYQAPMEGTGPKQDAGIAGNTVVAQCGAVDRPQEPYSPVLPHAVSSLPCVHSSMTSSLMMLVQIPRETSQKTMNWMVSF